ncbi:MAG TPA: dihydroneopterin aldolase [Dongiaceae bacterium]|jgi:dihydroneopterin aldolase|nr:dihydroneopterin aldolase [Dongiaceae bacterium]
MSDRTYKLFVRNLLVPTRIGIHQHERLAPQKVRITVELTAREPSRWDDDYDRVLCYADLVTRIRGVAGGAHTNLVETLAEHIAADCLILEDAVSVQVRVEKLEQFKDAESVGIEIIRNKAASPGSMS